MLSIKSLFFTYPKAKTPLLEDINLDVKAGHIYGLLGANGEGKSTLLYLMAGLLFPKRGNVTVNGSEAKRRLPSTLSEIFLVPEEISLPNVTLQQYIKLNAPFYPNFSEEDLKKYLEQFRLDTDIHLGKLSMGQKKKAFVAFALACNTSLLLMDEPTNGLDIPGKADFRRAIVSAMNDDRTIIISTHQVRDLDRVLDQVVIMAKHKIILDESMSHLTEKLAFVNTNDPSDCNSAVYFEAVPGGYDLIRENKDGEETDVNLETLFNFVFSNPEKMHQLL
jgi:ABC-2 type transport system ATP-binding protein